MDSASQLQQQVQSAFTNGKTIRIIGGGSKAFYGRPVQADQILDTTIHRGVIAYEPTELVITAKAGTPLTEIETLLSESGQQLPFEPPNYNGKATIGGTVAAGLSGPRRFYAGAVRDAILGVSIVNGKGEILNFGGQVMKNVAGYDLARLMAGSLGTLGVILQVSIKTRPVPIGEMTIKQPLSNEQILIIMRQIIHLPVTQTASIYDNGHLYLRIGGSKTVLASASKSIAGEILEDDAEYWRAIKNHQHDFFLSSENLWRISLPGTAPLPRFEHQLMIEWNGCLRWIKTHASAVKIRSYAQTHGGHATRFHRLEEQEDCFQAMSAPSLKLQQKIKHALDPKGILNPGRMYTNL